MDDVLAEHYGFGPAFAAEWKRQWGTDVRDLMVAADGSVARLWGDFALSANQRGRETALDMAGRLSRVLPSLRGRTALDVGCGVGGTAIAMAELGAAATGIDLDPDRVLLARANAADHAVTVTFAHGDALVPGAGGAAAPFDAVVAEDVLEHVSDARRGVHAIAHLLAPGGLARVTIPNGDAVPFVAADGHYLLAGLTLLRDREHAEAYFDASFDWGTYDVGNYHSFDDYRRWFGEAGLTIAAIEAVDPMAWEALDAGMAQAKQAVAAAAARADLPASVRRGLEVGWDRYVDRVATARELGEPGATMRVGARFWRFYVTNGEVRRTWAWRLPQRWAWRAAVKRIPGAAGLVGAVRRSG